MTLDNAYFEKVKAGEKTLELRLLDEKRAALKVGERVEFFAREGDEKIQVEIIGLHRAESFSELLSDKLYPLSGFGDVPRDEALSVMRRFYSESDEKKYGVLGIEIALVNGDGAKARTDAAPCEENGSTNEPEVIDIYSKGEYPSNELSNFYPHEFFMDGVRCGSMEGFLQSLKYRSQKKQRTVCALCGKEAKRRGQYKILWRLFGVCHWGGVPYKRNSDEFKALVMRAYREMHSQNEGFRAALSAADGKRLLHTLGGKNKRKTILTEAEFISCLEQLRKK